MVFGAALSAAVWMPAAQALCFGLPVSSTGCNTLDGNTLAVIAEGGSCEGTDRSDVMLCVNPAGCVIDVRGGRDVAKGASGPDVICAGSGNDAAVGKEGNDFMDGGSGVDLAVGDNSFFDETHPFESCVEFELKYTCDALTEPRP